MSRLERYFVVEIAVACNSEWLRCLAIQFCPQPLRTKGVPKSTAVVLLAVWLELAVALKILADLSLVCWKRVQDRLTGDLVHDFFFFHHGCRISSFLSFFDLKITKKGTLNFWKFDLLLCALHVVKAVASLCLKVSGYRLVQSDDLVVLRRGVVNDFFCKLHF